MLWSGTSITVSGMGEAHARLFNTEFVGWVLPECFASTDLVY
jgi:hypothetical protein